MKSLLLLQLTIACVLIGCSAGDQANVDATKSQNNDLVFAQLEQGLQTYGVYALTHNGHSPKYTDVEPTVKATWDNYIVEMRERIFSSSNLNELFAEANAHFSINSTFTALYFPKQHVYRDLLYRNRQLAGQGLTKEAGADALKALVAEQYADPMLLAETLIEVKSVLNTAQYSELSKDILSITKSFELTSTKLPANGNTILNNYYHNSGPAARQVLNN